VNSTLQSSPFEIKIPDSNLTLSLDTPLEKINKYVITIELKDVGEQ
jgi:hypothetical protein